MSGRAVAIVAAAFLALAACRSTRPDTGLPEGYVSIPEKGDAVRAAVAPNGNRIVVRRHRNPPEGTLAFWRDAVQAELTDGKGYELLESNGVAGRDGRPVWEFLYRVTRTEGEYLYLVLVRVSGSDVHVTEAGGREAELEADLPALRDKLR